MNIPEILNGDMFFDAPLEYKWRKDTAEFYYVDASNEKVYAALEKLNHKATYGIATALSEWIYWRVAKYNISTEIAKMCLEAQWASIINKSYSFDWTYSGDYISDPVNGPVWTMLKLLESPRETYYNGNYFFPEIDKIALLARYISPDKNFFDKWFSDTLQKAADFFPAQYNHREVVRYINYYAERKYDSSNELVIPREFFFDLNYNYKTADNVQIINQFLTSLDYQNNKVLNSPEEMLKLGFIGAPYQYKG